MNINHQRISENTKSDVITYKVASLTVNPGNRNCCNAALLDIKWFYRKLKQQSFHNVLRSLNFETKKTQKVSPLQAIHKSLEKSQVQNKHAQAFWENLRIGNTGAFRHFN